MGVTASSISRVTGVEVSYKNFNAGRAAMLPQRLAIVGPGNTAAGYPAGKVEVSNAAEVAKRFGYGSPLHLAARQLFPESGSGAGFPVLVCPVAEGAGATAAAGSISVTGTALEAGGGKIYVGGVAAEFAVAKGAEADAVMAAIGTAINGVLEMPVTAGDIADAAVPLAAKFKGTIGNQISLEFDCSVAGLVFNTVAMAGGSVDGDVSAALAEIGGEWVTFVLDCFPYDSAANLDKYQTWGEDRWSVLVKKGALVAHGCAADFAARTAVTDARKSDYVNFLVQSTGSRELPCVIAAKGLLDIVGQADKDPACGYKGALTGLHAGADSAQETYAVRNSAMQKGASTNVKEGSVARLCDVVTFYHPEGEGKYPSRRYVVDAVKLMNIVYNVRLVLEADGMTGVPLVPDHDVVTNPNAVQPKAVRGMLKTLAASLAKKALVSDAAWTQENLEADIDGENPKRLNVKFPVKLSGNIEVASCDIFFGFYLGGE